MADSNEVDADLKFSIIPEWLLDSKVSHKAIRVYAIIARYADSNTLTAWPARQTIATRANCTVKSVDRAVAELVEIGALSKENRRDDNGGNHTSLYTLKRIRVGTKTTQGGRQNRPRGGDKIDPLTITSELEPVNNIKRTKVMDADSYEPSSNILTDSRYDVLDLQSELEQFRHHHMARGSKFKDWDRAFRNWLSNALKWQPKTRRAVSQTRAQENLARLRELERGK